MTDEEINREAAELCGWRKVTPENPAHCAPSEVDTILFGQNRFITKTDGWANEATSRWEPRFNDRFCTDRNTLPELLAAVERIGKECVFADLIKQYIPYETPTPYEMIAAFRDCRMFVECALRACGRWKEASK